MPGDDIMPLDYRLVCYHITSNKFSLEIRYDNGNGEHLADFTNTEDLKTYVDKHFNGLKVILLT